MAVGLLYNPIMQFTEENGAPIPFAKIFSYLAGTSTLTALFQDPAGATPHTNPAIADSGGHLTAYATLGLAIKINVQDENGVQIPGFPRDNLVITPYGSLTLIDDYSATNSQAGESMDPGEIASPNLATNASEEIKQLRFRLGEMTGGVDWRTTYVTRTMNGLQPLTTSAADTVGLFPPAGTSTSIYSFVIPDGWQPASNMVWSIYRRSSSGEGTARMQYQIDRERDGQAVANIVTTTAINFLPGHGNIVKTTVLIPGAALLVGDVIVMALQRLGEDAGDTDMGNVLALNSHLIYTGVGSR